MNTFLPDLRGKVSEEGSVVEQQWKGQLSHVDLLSHDEGESAKLKQIAHDQKERVEDFFPFRRAALEEDDQDGDPAQYSHR